MSDDSFHVSLGTHLTSGFVHHARPLWKLLGNLESRMLRKSIEQTPIRKPIYVAGLARSGTSVLIEILASHPNVATHQYRDFPFLYIPYWWRQTLERSAPRPSEATERAHGDRLVVTSHSPESMEEPLWMAYFARLHRSNQTDALDAAAMNPKFEQFYRDHIRKLLLISHRARYAAKGNYNLTRLPYLQKLFPDARFVLPIRRPADHIASLMKQHRLFNQAADKYPRSVAHLDRVGHFEFGAHRRCINVAADRKTVESIESFWRGGQDVRGWARYWASLYRWVGQQLQSNDALRQATFVMHYETLCDKPASSIRGMLDHCDLADTANELINRWTPTLSRPTYYQAQFSADDEQAIAEETAEVAAAWGY